MSHMLTRSKLELMNRFRSLTFLAPFRGVCTPKAEAVAITTATRRRERKAFMLKICIRVVARWWRDEKLSSNWRMSESGKPPTKSPRNSQEWEIPFTLVLLDRNTKLFLQYLIHVRSTDWDTHGIWKTMVVHRRNLKRLIILMRMIRFDTSSEGQIPFKKWINLYFYYCFDNY